LVPRSKIWILAAGLLIIAVLIEFALWFGGSPASVPPSNASTNVPAKLRTLVTSPALLGSQSLPDDIRKVDICGFGKVALVPTDPMAASRYVGERTEKAVRNWLSKIRRDAEQRYGAAPADTAP
jgi:hypothetical protein